MYTNVTGTGQLNTNPVTNWAGGGPNSEYMLLGASQVTPLFLKNATFMISGRAKMNKYTGFRPFLSLPWQVCLLGGLITIVHISALLTFTLKT